MLVRRVEVHRTYLVHNLTDSSPQLSAAIHARLSFLQTFTGDSRANAAMRALALLDGEINRQATVLTYMDCFRLPDVGFGHAFPHRFSLCHFSYNQTCRK
jgi:hypothetical protein